jgi:hypothetical protein
VLRNMLAGSGDCGIKDHVPQVHIPSLDVRMASEKRFVAGLGCSRRR